MTPFTPLTPATPRRQQLLVILATLGGMLGCLIFGLPLWEGRNTGLNPNGEYTGLRGGIILVMNQPWQTVAELRTYSIQRNHTISSVIGQTGPDLKGGPVIRLADPMWNDIESLRQEWCLHPPATKRPPRLGMGYRVVLACHPNRNPILYFPEGQLDPRLHAAMNAVP
jgi:hypothetical protein